MSTSRWRKRLHYHRELESGAQDGLKTTLTKKKLAGALQRIFTQPDQEAALLAYAAVRAQFGTLCGKAMQILEDGLSDVLTFMAFPPAHWSRISSTNPIERINEEIRRRTRVVGVFPSVASALRLIGMILLEQTEDWHADKR